MADTLERINKVIPDRKNTAEINCDTGRDVPHIKKMGDENGGKWFAVGLDGCLFLYPDEKWEGFVKQLKSLLGTKEAYSDPRCTLSA